MNKFSQHIPNFIDVNEPIPSHDFETTDDLLMLDIVQRYGKDDNFSHFAMSGNHLMEISDSGFYWWVVGYVKNPEDVDLPKWNGGKYRAKLPSGKEVILTDEVISSCGSVLTLKDGAKVENLRG